MEPHRVRVLLVDDDQDFLDICAAQLQTADHRIDVQTATSGEECLERVGADAFDVVLADYWMQPGMTGLQLLSSLRERGHEVPFIFLTARGSEGVAAEALRLGADDYLVKGAERAEYTRLARSVVEAAERFNQPAGLSETSADLPAGEPAAAVRHYEQLRDDFERQSEILEKVMSAMSHDLKTPLVSIAGFADLLRDPRRSDSEEERAHKLERIARNAQKMHRMIEELLTLRPHRPADDPEADPL